VFNQYLLLERFLFSLIPSRPVFSVVGMCDEDLPTDWSFD